MPFASGTTARDDPDEEQHPLPSYPPSSEIPLLRGPAGRWLKQKKVWHAEAEDSWSPTWEADDNAAYWMDDDGLQWDEEYAYWNDWPSPSSSWDDAYTYEEHDTTAYEETADMDKEKTQEEIDEDRRVEEAYTLAAEANRTLAEAKQVVARVRAARGYYDPTGTKGHTGKGKGKPKAGKGKGATAMFHLWPARTFVPALS